MKKSSSLKQFALKSFFSKFYNITKAYKSKKHSFQPIGHPDARKTIDKSYY